jgi:hypothetical protein
MLLLQDACRKNSDTCLIIDATARLIARLPAPFDSREPFLYTVLLRRPQENGSHCPIFEFVSASQTFSCISSSLLEYFERYAIFLILETTTEEFNQSISRCV